MTLRKKLWFIAALSIMVYLLSGCAGNIPDRIRLSPAYNIKVKQVQAAPKRYLDAQVRWGGEIISIENKQSETWFEVLARPLDSGGYPAGEGATEGRFLARMPGFLDPAVYAPGRELTVSGRLQSTITRLVGEFSYRFPLVSIEDAYLWPLRKDVYDQRYNSPWNDPFYDSFYAPWYPPYYGDSYYPYPRRRHWRQ